MKYGAAGLMVGSLVEYITVTQYIIIASNSDTLLKREIHAVGNYIWSIVRENRT